MPFPPAFPSGANETMKSPGEPAAASEVPPPSRHKIRIHECARTRAHLSTLIFGGVLRVIAIAGRQRSLVYAITETLTGHRVFVVLGRTDVATDDDTGLYKSLLS
jgi:hypothetical protein